MRRYVIITPAHNEEAFIGKTLESVVSQTVRPLKWVIVNDASTDRTRPIVEEYIARHDFIQLINVERPQGRHFGNKVKAFNRGLAAVAELPYDFIGNLDGDVSFGADYFGRVLQEFDSDPRLGLAGGMVSSCINGRFVSQRVAPDSVAGAVQLFRRACFEEVGGLPALACGGEDAAVEITARMKGWRVRTLPECRVLEHRRTGTAIRGPLAARVRDGHRFHSLGYGLLFYGLRCVRRSLERPVLIGSAASFCGYLISFLRRDPVVLAPEVVRYLRREQRAKLVHLFKHFR